MHKVHGWARIRGRNFNTQLDVVSVFFSYCFYFMEKCKFKNIIFKLKIILIKSRWKTCFKIFYK